MSHLELPTQRLLRFNSAVLAQAQALARAHEAPGAPPYARPVGAHLRHVIEHYDALLHPAQPGVADYDARARDVALEHSPQLARQRLQALLQTLHGLQAPDLDATLRVRGLGGLQGEFEFEVTSTLARELVFVASHAVHHYAVLMPHCQDHAIEVDGHFGKAPATVAHEVASAVRNAGPAATKPHTHQETPCPPRPVTA